MNTLLRQFLEALQATSMQARISAVLGALVLAAMAGAVLTYSNKPHFEMLVSGLDASESARVQSALASTNVRWDVSQPPGPFVVYVDRKDRHQALAAIASAGALDQLPGGILGSDGGMASVFLSAGERQQMVRKREWQEMERLLEQLDFVRAARVRTSVPDARASSRSATSSASVTLTLATGRTLGRDQAQTVASLVRFGLGISADQLVIADQEGKSVFDGSDLAGGSTSEWLDHKQRHDSRLAIEVNQLLAEILGPGRARVTVSSDWDFDRSTVIAETTDPEKRAVVSETSSETEDTNQPGSMVGGAAGTPSTLQVPGDGFGVDNVGVVRGVAGGAGGSGSSTTRDSRKDYVTPRITTQTVRTAPLLERMSISLTLDSSLKEQRVELESLVKAAVGFDSRRSDQLVSALVDMQKAKEALLAPLAEGAVGAEDAVGEAEPAAEPGLSPWLELMITRGVEIASALAFIVLLGLSLRGARSAVDSPVAAGASSDPTRDAEGNTIDPEMLALAQVQEFLRNDPDRVISILSNWAREEHTASRS